MPWTLAGLTVGAWGIVENDGVPDALPPPGVVGIHRPLAWYDSAAVRWVDGASWEGFDAPLATAEGLVSRAGLRRGRSVVDVRGGDFGHDENGLTIARGDSLRWWSFDVMEGHGGSAAGFESFGRHLWGAAGGWSPGRPRIEGGFRQRGSAAILNGTEEQSASGQSGFVRHQYVRGAGLVALSFRRGLDRHSSFSEVLEGSRRDAQVTEVSGEASLRREEDVLAAHGRWRRERIDRSGADAFETQATSGWAAGRYDRHVGDGWLRIGLGAGSHGALDGLQVAPEVSYRTAVGPIDTRIAVERLLHPVTADLGVAEDAFLQRTWAGVIEVSGRWPVLRANARVLGGSTTDRALVHHLPLEDLWLRDGATRDLDPYRFGLVQLECALTWRGLSWVTQGFALSRDRSVDEAHVDPAHGLSSKAAVAFHAFSGDLGVRLGAEIDRIGPRESESSGLLERRLASYWTSSATLALSLADADVSIGVRNLEDRPREEVWIDSSTGEEALGPGRELRFALTLRLPN